MGIQSSRSMDARWTNDLGEHTLGVILHGSFYGTNFGDTLLLRVFADQVRILSASKQVFATNVSQHAAHFCSVVPLSIMEAIKSGMPIVFCGGGYFGEPPRDQLKWRVQLWRKHLLLGVSAAWLNRTRAVLGVGVGPLSSWWVRKPVSYIFERTRVCAVRDEESVEYCRQHFHPEVVYVPVADAVLGCTPEQLLGLAELSGTWIHRSDGHGRKRNLVVHLAGDSEDADARRSLACGIIASMRRHDDVRLVLLSDNSPGVEPDFFDWFKECDPDRITTAPFTEPSMVLRSLADCWGVVTTKLHVGICGAVLGKSLISTPRHPKTLRLYRQLGRDDVCMPLLDAAGNPQPLLERTLSGASAPVQVPPAVVEQARQIWRLLHNALGGDNR